MLGLLWQSRFYSLRKLIYRTFITQAEIFLVMEAQQPSSHQSQTVVKKARNACSLFNVIFQEFYVGIGRILFFDHFSASKL
jgi:hypothetical protein